VLFAEQHAVLPVVVVVSGANGIAVAACASIVAVGTRIEELVEDAIGVAVQRATAVAGGDLNDAFRVELAGGDVAFAKTSPDARPGGFAAEAAGLRWLGEAAGGDVAVPEVRGAGDHVLVLGWVESARPAVDRDARLGRGLARVHAAGAPAFGATPDRGPTILGPLVLPADAAGPDPTWGAFHGTCRLAPVGRLAHDRGALPAGTSARLQLLIDRLDALAGPAEPPARIHGDLWSGNVMTGPDGGPVLIDPAASGGHRETDLAMLRLFGSLSPAFLAAYEAVAPLAPGHDRRVALHQVFPLLVHAALFGGGYGASARRTIDAALAAGPA
jgi:fructosamine-3-kinase